MFEDLNEYDYVAGLLAEYAAYPRYADIANFTGERSELARRVNDLITALTSAEQKTIAAKPERNLAIGFSWESKLLCQLWQNLLNAETPAKLKAVLPGLLQDLLKAMVIGRDLQQEGLIFEYRKIEQLATKGKKFSDNQRGLDDLGCVILEVLVGCGKDASAATVWDKLKVAAEAGHPVIQEVDDSAIYWKAKKTGKEKTTPKRSFSNRLSGYRDKD